MMLEAKTVAEALGVRFGIDVDKRIAGGAEVGVHKTSMLQDLERGRPMEIDALLGAVVELGDYDRRSRCRSAARCWRWCGNVRASPAVTDWRRPFNNKPVQQQIRITRSALNNRTRPRSRLEEEVPEILTRRLFSIGLGAGLFGNAVTPNAHAMTEGSLIDELGRIEQQSGGRLGVAIHHTGMERRYGHRIDERFPMCSTFKVLACSAVLQRVDAGHENLSRRIRFEASDLVPYSPVTKDHADGDGMTLGELCQAAMTQSDNTAANLILASLGGPPAVTAYARSIGDTVTRLDRTETTLNEAIPGDPRDTTTPNAMVGNLHSLVVGGSLSRQSREQLTTWLVSNRTGGARLRAGISKRWRVGDKTGSGDRGTANDVAVIWPPDRDPLIVCVYLTDTKASFDASNATIASVGRAVEIMWET